MPQTLHAGKEEAQEVVVMVTVDGHNRERSPSNVEPSGNIEAPGTSQADTSVPSTNLAGTAVPSTSLTGISVPSRRPRQIRYRSRPLAPLDEARKILSQVEMQRAAADADSARALHLIGQNIGRIADAAEKYLFHMGYN